VHTLAFDIHVTVSHILPKEKVGKITAAAVICLDKLFVFISQQYSAMQKAACHFIPRGFRPTYTLCLDEECQDLLKQYEESGDRDIADHLIVSLM